MIRNTILGLAAGAALVSAALVPTTASAGYYGYRSYYQPYYGYYNYRPYYGYRSYYRPYRYYYY